MLQEYVMDKGQPALSWVRTVGQSHYLPFKYRVRISSFCKSRSQFTCVQGEAEVGHTPVFCTDLCICRAAVTAGLKEMWREIGPGISEMN